MTVHINTEIIFALFDLVGFRFPPRLRDLRRQRLYTSGGLDMHCYPRLAPYVRWRLRRPRILDWWDEMLRVALITAPATLCPFESTPWLAEAD